MINTVAPARAANGNPGIVPPQLSTPGAALPGAATPSLESRLSSIHVQAPKGMAPATDAHAAAANIAATHERAVPSAGSAAKVSWDDLFGRGGGGWDDQGQGSYGYDEPQQQHLPDVSRADKDRAMNTLRGVQKMFSKLGVSDREGNGGNLPVEFEPDFPNAAYAPQQDGSEKLIIGSDPETQQSFAKADDVLAHEYSHRVVNNVLGLEPVGESGAVNESLADTFAAAYDTKDWTIGESVRKGGLRDMAHPDRAQDAIQTDRGMMRRPANIKDYLDLPIAEDTDMGGVHLNVGIPNKAASLIGDALGRDTMAKIYISAVKNYMGSQSGIADTARATVAAATDQFGQDSKQVSAVMQAWQSVGLSFRNR